MKNTHLIAVIIAFFVCKILYGQNDKLNVSIDLNGDGIKEKVELNYEDDKFILRINSAMIDIEADNVQTIVDEKNKDRVFYFLDFDSDSIKEIAICFESPLFADRSSLRVFKYQNDRIEQLFFCLSKTNCYKEAVSVGKINIIDSRTNNIYVLTERKQVNAGKNGKMQFLYGVSYFNWNKSSGKFLYIKKKFFSSLNRKRLDNLIF